MGLTYDRMNVNKILSIICDEQTHTYTYTGVYIYNDKTVNIIISMRTVHHDDDDEEEEEEDDEDEDEDDKLTRHNVP